MRSRGNSMLANPVLVGAVTVLVTVVAVFLAYNANNGLPFVPTTELRVRLADGAQLVSGNEVRAGGHRVGIVSAIDPVQLGDGSAGAELTLRLDRAVGAVPADTTVAVRPRSALGLKYVELNVGRSRDTLADGATLPVAQSRASTDIDRVLEIFDERTRDASQANLRTFGDALAGRGLDLGRAIDELPRVFTHLEPVMRTLAAQQTRLDRLFRSLGNAAREVAPVSAVHARLFTTMADTWAAVGADERALKDTIARSPSTLTVSTGSLRVQRPFLAHTADFGTEFAKATRELRAALPDIGAAIAKGIGPQRRAVDMNERLRGALEALGELTGPPGTLAAVRGLTATVATLNPQVRFLGPYQTVCNYWNYFWTGVAEHFSEPDSTGHAQRALVNMTGRQDNSLGSMGANAPANGEKVLEGTPQYFHGPVYAHAINPDGTADCESGQRGYLYRQARYAGERYKVHSDPRNPGSQGPTFMGRERVPEGQTFAASPETGPYADFPLSETGDR